MSAVFSQEDKKGLWSNRRRDLLAKAFINLFQALVVASFVSEAFLKAGVGWKVGFVTAIGTSLVLGVLLCPEKETD